MLSETSAEMIAEEDNKDTRFRKILNESLKIFFKDALKTTLQNPIQAYYFLRTIRWQKKAARVRSSWEQQGIHVPPIMIFSITNRCNLHCKGCYNQALRQSPQEEMSAEKMESVIAEAKDLGISFVIIGGGEPLVREEIVDITEKFPEIIFLVFTNGLLIDDDLLKKLKGQNNFVPVISLEGLEEETDGRRGAGVYKRLQNIIKKIKGKRIFWSVSLTVTQSNFDAVTDSQFIQDLYNLGCKLFFFVEYTPIREGTEDWILTEEQRVNLLTRRDLFRSKFKALFIAIPGDEEEIGGCLSAGRGFVHISAEGNVEPCPFAPYSDTNLRDFSLKDALQSEFLRAIRQNHDQLHETEGGCALWVKRAWVRSLLNTK
ncbi:MAG: radical SAM protein [Candidatus Aminicenantes bacterium]|nr:radical SAM protein [Candidatus Aminicenantes bacterium]MDH5383326.1 radical SAM protein [Candidatus Aminicenantes bacterium]MDH5744626.1 radical SAM protein [Candidatus Aminicenantes bacterium]